MKTCSDCKYIRNGFYRDVCIVDKKITYPGYSICQYFEQDYKELKDSRHSKG